jgi:hypothetical protein
LSCDLRAAATELVHRRVVAFRFAENAEPEAQRANEALP